MGPLPRGAFGLKTALFAGQKKKVERKIKYALENCNSQLQPIGIRDAGLSADCESLSTTLLGLNGSW
jgi:hypothetical protein